MYELVTKHLDVYQRIGSDLSCMFILVSTGLVESVVHYCCLCMAVFYNLVTFAMQENIKQYAIKLCETQQIYHRDICFFNQSLWKCHSTENYGC
jgi:hypothetical protein